MPTKRMKDVDYTGIRRIFERAMEKEKLGEKVIHMEIGRPDFPTPKNIRQKAIEALDQGFVHYTSDFGTMELRETIAKKIFKDLGIEFCPGKEIIITGGAVEGIAIAVLGLIDVGEEVLIPNPCFPAYNNQVRIAGGIPISVPLKLENGFKIDIEEMEKRVTSRTKMLIINSPHNPTGVVYSKKEIEEVACFARRNDLILVSDEVYEKIIFSEEHFSPAMIPEMKERIVLINSTSKTFSMTGWRVGFVAANSGFIDAMIRVHQDILICACSFGQKGAAEAFGNLDFYIKPLIKEFLERREIVKTGLERIGKFDFVNPEGAFYVFPSVKSLGISSEKFCEIILDETGVALVPGTAFGDYGDDFFRLSFTCSKKDLKEGLNRLEEFVKKNW